MKDLYQVLGVEKSADQNQIKKAFHKLAVQFHPDKNPGNKEAEEKFKEISSAYNTLSDPDKRSKYDQFGDTSGATNTGPGSNINWDDILRNGGFGFDVGDLFTRGRNKKSVFKGEDLYKTIRLGFMEAINGTKKTIKVSYGIACSKCSGTGAEDGNKFSACNVCSGQGKVGYVQGFMKIMSTCRSCSGTGRKVDVKCKNCNGTGQNNKEEKLSINIPPGIEENTTMRLTNKGLPGINGGPNGDLFVSVEIEQHPQFRRQELHIISEEVVKYTDAILGAEKDIETIHGPRKLTIPPHTNHGATVKISGCGVNIDNRKGDHFVLIRVGFPDKDEISEQEKELLEKIRNLES